MSATGNMFPKDGDNILSGGMSDTEKLFKIVGDGLAKDVKLFEQIKKLTADIKKNMLDARGESDHGSMNGSMGKMPSSTGNKVLNGLGIAAGVGSLGMAMMPDTMSAVTQRIGADTVAGISGLSARQVILRSNRAMGNGATSAMGGTMAAAGLFAGGGYTASSKTFANVMPQIGGLSALTGGSNEQMAAGLASINSMRFLRIGVQARDSQGNLKPPNTIINDTYRFLYGGRKITPEQAAMVLNPGSKGYATISAIAGGDPNLMGIIQMGIIARAKNNGKALTSKDLSGSSRSLDILGVGKDSPIRSNFNYQTSEARKLQATEKGLVGGFNVATNSVAAVNNGFSRVAEEAAGVANALAGLRGALQTIPSLGNTGGTLAGIGSAGMGFGMQALQMHMLGNMINRGGGAAGAAAAGRGPGFLGGMMSAGAAAKFGKFLKVGGPVLGGLMSGYSGYKEGKAGGAFNWGSVFKSAALAGGTTAGLTAMTGPGALMAGLTAALVAGGANALGQVVGRGGDGGCSHGSIGPHACGVGGDNPTAGFAGGNSDRTGLILQMPVPKGTPVTSGFGYRDNSKNPGISSNHQGIDYGVGVGTHVTAAADGVVAESGVHKQYGYYIIINHGVKATLYAHLSKRLVSAGQSVKAGQVIGLSGGKKGAPGAGSSTGPHLHFEVRDKGGVGARGRVNPQSWFGKAIGTISNLFKKVKSFFVGKKDDKFNPDKIAGYGVNFANTSSLSSIPLSESLSSSLMSGSPIDFSSFKKEFSSSALKAGVKGSNGKTYINSNDDLVSGDKLGMVGGSRAGLMKMLYNAGFRGKGLETAFAVALAESGGRAGAHNFKNRDLSYGLFQINMKDDDPASPNMGRNRRKQFGIKNNSALYDPATNIKAAYQISNKGTWWKQWGAFTDGRFAKYLDDANRVRTANGMGGDLDQGILNTDTLNNQNTGTAGARSSSTLNNKSTNVVVNVSMSVSVPDLNRGSLGRISSDLRKALEHEFRVKGIAGN